MRKKQLLRMYFSCVHIAKNDIGNRSKSALLECSGGRYKFIDLTSTHLKWLQCTFFSVQPNRQVSIWYISR